MNSFLLLHQSIIQIRFEKELVSLFCIFFIFERVITPELERSIATPGFEGHHRFALKLLNSIDLSPERNIQIT